MSAARELAPGQIIGGGYTLRSRIGSTTWATTYAGLAAPRRDVAIKIYEPNVAERADIVAALERADRAAASLPAHLVLHALAGGRDPASGAFYRVTRLSAHPSLAQLIELCPLSLDELVVFVGNAARVLAAAHERGLVHGALKPTNVFVGPAPKHAVQIGDFGATACLGAWRAPPSEALPWLSPEQRAGVAPTAASDVFGLALLAFHAVTRAVLRVGDDEGAKEPASIQAGAVGVALPPELDAVFSRALSPMPRKRHGSVIALAEDFRTTLGAKTSQNLPLEFAETALGVPIGGALPGSRARARRAWIAGAAAAALVAGGSIAAWRLTRPVAASPSPSPSPSTSTPTSTPTSTETPSPSPSPSPAPVKTGAGAPADAASAAISTSTEISVECQPACEFVMIDNKAVKHFPMKIAPGVHGVGVSRAGFFGDWRKVTVTKGEHEVVKFKLLVDSRKKRR